MSYLMWLMVLCGGYTAGHDACFKLDAGMLKGSMEQEHPVMVDGHNVVEPDEFISEGFVYKGIRRGDKNEHQMK